jgi:hypothetical protein
MLYYCFYCKYFLQKTILYGWWSVHSGISTTHQFSVSISSALWLLRIIKHEMIYRILGIHIYFIHPKIIVLFFLDKEVSITKIHLDTYDLDKFKSLIYDGGSTFLMKVALIDHLGILIHISSQCLKSHQANNSLKLTGCNTHVTCLFQQTST